MKAEVKLRPLQAKNTQNAHKPLEAGGEAWHGQSLTAPENQIS